MFQIIRAVEWNGLIIINEQRINNVENNDEQNKSCKEYSVASFVYTNMLVCA